MTEFFATPVLLLIWLGLIFTASKVLFFKKWKNESVVRGMFWSQAALFLFLVITAWYQWIDGGMVARVWKVKWIESVELAIRLDGAALLALSVFFLGCLETAVFEFKSLHPSRTMGAVGWLVTGVSLVVLSGTPWLAIFGFGLTLASMHLFSVREPGNEIRAQESTRAAIYRLVGWFSILFGTLILAEQGSLFWDENLPALVAGGKPWGLRLVLLGIFLQFMPYPFLGWFRFEEEKGDELARGILGEWIPAFCAIFFLLRWNTVIGALPAGEHSAFAVVAVVTALFTALAGLFQSSRARLPGYLFAVLLQLAFAASCEVSMSAGLSVAFGALVLHRAALKSTKAGVLLRVLIGLGLTGFVGYTTASGLFQLLITWAERPAPVVLLALALLIYSWMAWRWVFQGSDMPSLPNWGGGAWGVFWLVAAAAAIWTGDWAGHVLGLSMEVDGGGLLKKALGLAATPDFSKWAANFSWVAGVYWGTWIVSALLGFWTCAGGRDHLKRWAETSAFPRWIGATAWGSLQLAAFSEKAVRTTTAGLNRGLDRWFWIERGPLLAHRGVMIVTGAVRDAEAGFTRGVRTTLLWISDFPARGLQRIQNGDVRWYVGFGVAWALAAFAALMWIFP